MPTSARSPRHRHGHNDDREDRCQCDQWPGALVVIEAVGGRALLVDLSEDANGVACQQVWLTGAGENSNMVVAPWLGPLSIATTVCTQLPLPDIPGQAMR